MKKKDNNDNDNNNNKTKITVMETAMRLRETFTSLLWQSLQYGLRCRKYYGALEINETNEILVQSHLRRKLTVGHHTRTGEGGEGDGAPTHASDNIHSLSEVT